MDPRQQPDGNGLDPMAVLFFCLALLCMVAVLIGQPEYPMWW